MPEQKVGWIGAGNLGGAICRRLLACNVPLAVFDIDPARVEALVALGAEPAASIGELDARSDIIFLAVASEAAAEAIAAGLAPRRGGGALIDMSTISPEASARMAATLATAGREFLRAPVSGSTLSAENGALTIFASGPHTLFETMTPLLTHLAKRCDYVGMAEEARVLKLVINMVVSVIPLLIGESMAFGAAHGVDRDAMIDALDKSVISCPLLAYKKEAMRIRDWTPTGSIDLGVKDLSLALAAGRDVDTPITRLAFEHFAAAQARGEGGLDFFSLTDRSGLSA